MTHDNPVTQAELDEARRETYLVAARKYAEGQRDERERVLAIVEAARDAGDWRTRDAFQSLLGRINAR
jgi:hypothetical protein